MYLKDMVVGTEYRLYYEGSSQTRGRLVRFDRNPTRPVFYIDIDGSVVTLDRRDVYEPWDPYAHRQQVRQESEAREKAANDALWELAGNLRQAGFDIPWHRSDNSTGTITTRPGSYLRALEGQDVMVPLRFLEQVATWLRSGLLPAEQVGPENLEAVIKSQLELDLEAQLATLRAL